MGIIDWFSMNIKTKKSVLKKTILDDLCVPKPHFYDGPWIIGGAAITFYETGDFEGCRDIDYFFKSPKQYHKFKSRFKRVKNAKYERYQSSQYSPISSENFVIKIDETTFNLVGFMKFGTPREIMETFDFTCCQIWTDGHSLGSLSRTKEHIDNKILCFAQEDQTKFLRVEERVKKYIEKGYEPNAEMLQYILKHF